MKFHFKLFLLIFILCKSGLVVSNNTNNRNNFAYLSQTLGSLVIQSNNLGYKKPVSALSQKVLTRITSPVYDNEGKIIIPVFLEPGIVTDQLTKDGESWIEGYFLNDQNFDFIDTLSSDQVKTTTSNASKTLSVFNDMISHKKLFSWIDTDQTKIIEPDIKKIENDFRSLDFSRTKISKIRTKDLFLRLFNLVQLKEPYKRLFNARSDQPPLYKFDEELEKLKYPTSIETGRNLALFDFGSTILKDSTFFIETAKSLLQIVKTINNNVQQTKTIESIRDASNSLINYFKLLDTLINWFNDNFIAIEPIFNTLVKKALDSISSARLKIPEIEFNKGGFQDLNLDQQNQVKNSLLSFVKSPAVKFYIFAGAPLRSLFKVGIELKAELQKAVKGLKTSIELNDLEKIEHWYINQIFDYAVSPYSREEELYYSRIFTYVAAEIFKLEKLYKLEPTLYEQSSKKLISLKSYSQVINKLKEFRKEHVSKLYKAIAMVSQNPFNEEFKKSLKALTSNNLKAVKELFVKLISSQYALQNLIRNLTAQCLKVIESEQLFTKLRRKSRERRTESLEEHMRHRFEQIQKDAVEAWDYKNIAVIFKNDIDKLSGNSTTEDTENAQDILRKILAENRKRIEDEEASEEDEDEEFGDW